MTGLLASAVAVGRRLLPDAPASAAVRGQPLSTRYFALIALGPALAVAAVITLRSEHLAQPGLRAAYVVAAIAAPVLIGTVWWWRRPSSRVGPLLVVLGYATWATSWQGSDVPLVFVSGIAAEPILAVITLYLVLAFPSGRLGSTGGRLAVGAWAAIVATAWLGAILLVADLGPTGPLSTCVPACPPNPFQIDSMTTRGLHGGWALLAAAAFVVLAAVAAAMATRVWRATPAQRRELLPIVLVAGLYLVAFALYHGARFFSPSTGVLAGTETLVVLARLCFPFGFLAALLASELFAVESARRLAVSLGSSESAQAIQGNLAGAVRDPALRVGVWDVRQHTYRDTNGDQLSRASAEPGQMWISVRDNGDRLAAIITDAGLATTPQLTKALTTAALIEVRALVAARQTVALRTRAVEAGDAERKRIARDLHDSLQQRLVALRIQLALAAERSEALGDDSNMADHLATELDLAIVEVRQLARRLLSPAALDNGVVAAVRALAENWPIRVTVHARGLIRHPLDVELAVYNCCLEALQNVVDHGGRGASAVVRLVERRAGIHFVVTDDGVGFDPANTERGPGLTRIVDRAILAGGCATIRSSPGRGVRVSGLVPTTPVAHAA